MKKKLLFPIVILATILNYSAFSQNRETKKVDSYRFDEKTAYEEAKAKGIKPSDIDGYVQFLKNDFVSKKALSKQIHKHTPYESAGTQGFQETVIYLEPNKPMSLGCPNMGFEQYNFNGWTGGTGTTSIGASTPTSSPVYNSTGLAILNAAGNNVPVTNTTNYHTIMSLPPVNPNLLNINGYDENSCKSVGTQTISELPLVSPFSFDPVSVRMNGEVANYRACRLKYITTTSSSNQRLSFSYAVVLEDGGHNSNESPYFKVEVKNESNGAILPGCSSYTFNPVSSTPSDSLKVSVTGPPSGIGAIRYRKWQYYSVDLSTLPLGTSVSINFEVGGCSQGGHWGYAYVDAECGGIGTPYANMCSGSNFATLIAPTGFNTYQWYGPSGIITGATNDTLIQTGATPGQTYTVSMVSPGGCALSQTVTVGFTTVNIINLNATSSCPGGNSGTASVQASGSNGVYTYSWTNTGTGAFAGNTQTVTGLAPGSYSVLVSSTTCGQASANLSVGVSPPFFIALNKPFCGNATIIPQPGGSNYIWYKNSVLISAPAGTNDTLYINNALNNDLYTVVYNNAQGCRDSIQYTLSVVAGGSSYFSNVSNVCPGDSNGTTVLNLSTPFSAPYNYVVTGPTSSNVIASTTGSTTTLSLTSLAPGTYTAVINDGVCIYNNTVTIGVIQTDFTVTPTNTVLCFPNPVTMNLNFGEVAPTSCGLSSSGGCASPTDTQIGTGTTVNSSSSYPSIYGHFYRNARHQMLFTATELNAAGITAGKISSLAFMINSIPSGYAAGYNGTLPGMEVKLKCTSATSLTANFDNTGLIQVFSGSYTPVVGWNTHNFTNTYEWDGLSNILVDVCYAYNGNVMWTSNPIMPSTNTTIVKCIYDFDDSAPLCGSAGSFVSTSVNRPNIKFGNCGASSPSSYTLSLSSNGIISNNYANDSIVVSPAFSSPPLPNGSVVYTVSVVNPTGNCVATQTVEITYPPLTTSITTAATNTTLCEGDNTSLSVGGAFNYNWFYQQGSTLVPISTSDTITVIPPAIGTNTYIVTGYAPCPSSTPDTKTITVTVTPKTNLFVSPIQDVTKCMNSPYVLTTGVGSTIPSNPGTPYTYSWTTLPSNVPAPGATNSSSYTVNSNTTSTLVVTVSGICAYPTSDTVIVSNFVDDLGIVINDSSSACAGTPFVLNAFASGGYPAYNYQWTMVPNTNVISNTSVLEYISPDMEGNYTFVVVVGDSCGYNRTTYQVINVLPPCTVEIPNIITPNGDGVNDFFKIKNIEHNPNTNVTVFDRWGIKVYENPNYNNEWNGTGVSDGTFFYVIDVPNDKKYSGFITVFKGN